MDKACSRHGKEQKYVRVYGEEICKERDQSEDLVIAGKIILE